MTFGSRWLEEASQKLPAPLPVTDIFTSWVFPWWFILIAGGIFPGPFAMIPGLGRLLYAVVYIVPYLIWKTLHGEALKELGKKLRQLAPEV
jgi:hypothetical protein